MSPQPAADDGDTLKNGLLAVADGRLRKVSANVLAGVAVYTFAKKWFDKGKTYTEHTVSIMSNDDIYDDVHDWVLHQLPPGKRRSMIATSVRGRRKSDDGGIADSSPREPSPKQREKGYLRLRYDGARTQKILIGGHYVSVSVERDESTKGGQRQDWVLSKMTFTASTTAGRDAVISMMEGMISESIEAPTTRLHVATTWGGWNSNSLQPRKLDTVVLASGQKERIVGDIDMFLEREETYRNLGIPWHRGYVFYGPPGTGKTSLARAIADHFKMDLYFIPLSDFKEDSDLIGCMRQINPRSLLVLEDVDVVHATKSRDDAETAGVSASALLQCLDGMVSPHGLITVMTTNELEGIDKALLRPGRADLIEQLDYIDSDQYRRLSEVLLGYDSFDGRTDFAIDRLTHAEVTETIKPYLGDTALMEHKLHEKVGFRKKGRP